uniref:Uncharacterized protein n=1 Tax=uncultured prokaryote TaxID=198431 RepID=A0A0H5Q3L4_9ZZZZ|nr:hypothetical protein [uncultured prokaryote]
MVARVYVPSYRTTGTGEFRNSAGVPVEIFSMGLCLGEADLGTDGSNTNPAILAAASSFWESVVGAAAIDGQVVLTQTKVSLISEAGKTLGIPVTKVENVHGGAGSAGGAPSELSCAVTLETQSNGKHSGRFYVPTPTAIDIQDFRFNPARLATFATAMGNAMTALRAALASVNEPNLAPSVSISQTANGAARIAPVTAVRVGNVPDVIRYRRDKLREAYTDSGYVPA